MPDPFYVVAFVKLQMFRRVGRTGPAGSFSSGEYEIGESDTLCFGQSRPCPPSGGLLTRGSKHAPHHLLSVLARMDQLPDTVFAQEQVGWLAGERLHLRSGS